MILTNLTCSKMNALEFRHAVTEMRRRQKMFWRLRKDDPNKESARLAMREEEKKVLPIVDAVMAKRPKGKTAATEDEAFFLAVADMVEKQRAWKKNGGGNNWYHMSPAFEAEKEVDRRLQAYVEKENEERRRQMEEEKKKQLTLF